MLDRITRICLENRLIIIAVSLVLLLIGVYVAMNMKVDVFPDLTAPTVTIMTDAHGMAPEACRSPTMARSWSQGK